MGQPRSKRRIRRIRQQIQRGIDYANTTLKIEDDATRFAMLVTFQNRMVYVTSQELLRAHKFKHRALYIVLCQKLGVA